MIAVYRGKSSVYEYIAAGALTGAGYKLRMGPKGMASGLLVGGFLGTIAGGISMVILKSSGMTMEEVRYWQYKWRDQRDDNIQGAIATALADLRDPLIENHDDHLGDKKTLSLDGIPDAEPVKQSSKSADSVDSTKH